MNKITTIRKSSFSGYSLEEALTESKRRYIQTKAFQTQMYECMPYYNIVVGYDTEKGYSIKLWDTVRKSLLQGISLSSTNKSSLLESDIYQTLKEYGFRSNSEEELLFQEVDFTNNFD